jgi:outer membrane protein assembly factor BamB
MKLLLRLAASAGIALSLSAGEAAALPDGYDQASAVFRGPTGSGLHLVTGVPTTWNEKEKLNVRWKAAVPIGGLGSPVVWGDTVIVAGATREKREVYAFSLKDGAARWTGTYTSSPDATVDYPVWQDLDAVMHAASTPATNGQQVFAMFANGEIAAFDLASGKNLWSKLIASTINNAYGLTDSLLVYRDSVIVAFDGDKTLLVRLNAADGAEIFSVDRADCTWASPILVKDGDAYRVITNGSGETACWDPETGKKLWGKALVTGDIAPSPICAAGKVVVNMKDVGIFAVNLADGEKAWSIDALTDAEISDANSLCTDGTYIYQFYGSVLVCIEAASGTVVYEKGLDISASYASPFVVGDKLYLVGGNTVVVGTTGKEFTIIATNQLDEYTDISPAVVPGNILVRTEESLYCLGAP